MFRTARDIVTGFGLAALWFACMGETAFAEPEYVGYSVFAGSIIAAFRLFVRERSECYVRRNAEEQADDERITAHVREDSTCI